MGNSSKDDSATSADASAGDVQPSNSGVYSEGEKVLAYHGPRIYEAKAPFTSPLTFSFNFISQRSLLLIFFSPPCSVWNFIFTASEANGNFAAAKCSVTAPHWGFFC